MNIMSIVMSKKYCEEKKLTELRARFVYPMTLEECLYGLKFENWKKDQEIERLNDLHLASILQSGEYKSINFSLQKRLRVVENIIMKRKRSKVQMFNDRLQKLVKNLLHEFDLSNVE